MNNGCLKNVNAQVQPHHRRKRLKQKNCMSEWSTIRILVGFFALVFGCSLLLSQIVIYGYVMFALYFNASFVLWSDFPCTHLNYISFQCWVSVQLCFCLWYTFFHCSESLRDQWFHIWSLNKGRNYCTFILFSFNNNHKKKLMDSCCTVAAHFIAII